MHFYTAAVLLLASIPLAFSSPTPDNTLQVREAAPVELVARACKNNKCKCKSGTKQGQYCGICDQVTNLGNGGSLFDIYECNSSGGCCDYGDSSICINDLTKKNCPKK
ncbi:hypothetical protein GQ44DRAFT_824155 [Phaeosphaeriaceae sp. PMI808]|nr:hypothetical protein GQ44DRAFT_824155 [Phaeosphaeriaceae sp. PMI808]